MSRAALKHARRVVVKVGTQVLLGEDGLPSLSRLFALMEDLALLRREGRDVLLVSSGATGLGIRRLGLPAKPEGLPLLQACAAVGQGELMGLYQSGFDRLDRTCAQVLLTQDDFSDPTRRANLQRTLDQLLRLGVIPVINENDTVGTFELEQVRVFGDNDQLSALVAASVGANLLLILSDVEGLYTANPREQPEARLLHEVPALTEDVLALAAGRNARGRGGMASKLEAARLATTAGVAVVIAHGGQPHVIPQVVGGQEVGTWFIPQPRSGADPLAAWIDEVAG